MSEEGLLRGLRGSELAGLSPLILLLEVTDELLSIYVLLGVSINEVELTSNELVSKLVPRFQLLCTDSAYCKYSP